MSEPNPKDYKGKTLQVFSVDSKKGVIGETGRGKIVKEVKK
jgi:hypothetical protein